MHMYKKKRHIVSRKLFDLPDLCDNIQPHHTKNIGKITAFGIILPQYTLTWV